MKQIQQNIPWTEKYRPRTLEEIVLPQRIKDKLSTGLYNNFIFQGTSGIGKTTLALILAQGRDFKKINASDDSGIDVVRDEIKRYCSTSSVKKDGKKVVVLDEADALTTKAQEAMRATLETFYRNAYFIMTMNYPEKILGPIRSRFEIINFNFTESEEKEVFQGYCKRLLYIGEQEGLKFTAEGLKELIKSSYPDLRAMIQVLQGISRTTKEITKDAVTGAASTQVDNDLFNFIISEFEPPKIFAYIKSRFMNKEAEAYNLLGTPFCNWLNENNKSAKVGVVAKIVHKYAFESVGVPDKLLSLVSCVFELSQAFK